VSLHFIVQTPEAVDETMAKAVAAGGVVVKEAGGPPWGYFGCFGDPRRLRVEGRVVVVVTVPITRVERASDGSGRSGVVIPAVYRTLLRDRRARRLLAGLSVSSLGDGMSTVTIAWLAVPVAPAGELGTFVGLALAAYTLPGVIGALAFTRFVRHRPARALVLVHCLLRTGFLGVIALLWALDALAPLVYVPLLASSSLMAAWGNAGEYTMLSELGGPDGRLAVNSLASARRSRSP
jgi:hypothetical protein